MNIEEAYNTIKKSVEAINTRGYATKAEYEKVECIKVLLTAYEEEKEKEKNLLIQLKDSEKELLEVCEKLRNSVSKDKIKAKIEELKQEKSEYGYTPEWELFDYLDGQIKVLQSLLEKE